MSSFYSLEFGVFCAPIDEQTLQNVIKPNYRIRGNDKKFNYFSGIYYSRFSAM